MSEAVHERSRLRDHPVTVALSYPSSGEASFAAALFPPHPELGGSRDHPLLLEVAEAVVSAGGVALRYEYLMPEETGAGRSGPVLPDTAFPKILDPWPQAVQLLLRCVAANGPLYALGYSLGACVMARLPHTPPWQRPVFVAPPLARQPQKPLGTRGEGALVLLGEKDFACSESDARRWLESDSPDEPTTDRRSLRLLAGSDHFLRGEEALVAKLALAHWLAVKE